jgi:D-glycero-alpha-D-manno-heptose-7-phosphate kinase
LSAIAPVPNGQQTLIVRAPLRLSLAGGGTDIDAYSRAYGGLVVSTTIDKHVYVVARPTDSEETQILSADYGTFVRHIPSAPSFGIDLALPKAILDEVQAHQRLQIFIASEVSPGTGLGSSGSVAVALTHALLTLKGALPEPDSVAQVACRVKIDRLGQPAGRQDEYAAAFGGMNVIRFSETGVHVSPIQLPQGARRNLEQRLLLFHTGKTRNSSTILRDQEAKAASKSPDSLQALHGIRELAERAIRLLEDGDLDGYGRLLGQSWLLKRRIATGISSSAIDAWYEAALVAGALGGKIAGAGGGGFLLLYVPDLSRQRVISTLERLGLRHLDFAFERAGVTVLLDSVLR